MIENVTLKFKDKCMWPIIDYMWSSQPLSYLEDKIWDENGNGIEVKVNILNDEYFHNRITYNYRCVNGGFKEEAFELFAENTNVANIDNEPAREINFHN